MPISRTIPISSTGTMKKPILVGDFPCSGSGCWGAWSGAVCSGLMPPPFILQSQGCCIYTVVLCHCLRKSWKTQIKRFFAENCPTHTALGHYITAVSTNPIQYDLPHQCVMFQHHTHTLRSSDMSSHTHNPTAQGRHGAVPRHAPGKPCR